MKFNFEKGFSLNFFIFLILMSSIQTKCRGQNVNFKVFGHQKIKFEKSVGDDFFSTYGIGEHDLFITNNFNNKWSFLGEVIVGPTATGFKTGIERARIKFAYNSKNSIIIGRMHTPVNFWNDVYHHGRLFFPTIDRPFAFETVVPMHTTGLRFQGQNFTNFKIGYDVVIGNGFSSNDLTDINYQKSVTLAVHAKPSFGTRINFSYYRDKIFDGYVGTHSGHSTSLHQHGLTSSLAGTEILYELYSFSFSSFKKRVEFLNETSANFNKVLNSEKSININCFNYLGYRFSNENVLFGLIDYKNISEKDVHIIPSNQTKVGIGFKKMFSHLLKINIQLEEYLDVKRSNMKLIHQKSEFKIQVAYGF